MKVPMKKCQVCGVDTELLYKVYDNAQQSHDVPICIDCAMNLIESLIERYPKRRDDSKWPRCKQQRFYDIMGEDEAIAFFTEFADVKIQNIGVQGYAEHLDQGGWRPRRQVALIVRSTYNNQWRMRVIDADLTVDEVLKACRECLREIFPKNRYPEDMV